ncbi:hypothetical protein TELCIR_13005 [Teladorsagia circumcincta]|uniref:Uncharacterized protein n=1 Tax=Teladorsagia circumcincta TaxID=45464 RepID=A0A2G9U568_TELCI|nr:hypothetical protein TELCIR_13005 [Teladorsagia circumcincta]
MLDDGLNLLANDDARSTRSKRSRASSKLYDDFLLNGFGTRTRHRSGSASEAGRRSRLISGVSDVFDELLFNGELNLQQAAEQLLHTLDELPSESSEVILPFILSMEQNPFSPFIAVRYRNSFPVIPTIW